jgi:hypothetical protein
MAVTESIKILPYVISNRKTIKLYLKVALPVFLHRFAIPHTWLRRA